MEQSRVIVGGSRSQAALLGLCFLQLQQPLGQAEGLVEAKRRGAAGVGFALLGGDGDNSEQLVLLGELVLQLINLHTES